MVPVDNFIHTVGVQEQAEDILVLPMLWRYERWQKIQKLV